jgi:hypothetical protein
MREVAVSERDEPALPWDAPKEYGRRFAEINARIERGLALSEYRAERPEDTAVLQYRLAKLAMAGEDIRRAIAVLETHPEKDEWIADAIVELRNACVEVAESFAEIDAQLVRLLNHFSG